MKRSSSERLAYKDEMQKAKTQEDKQSIKSKDEIKQYIREVVKNESESEDGKEHKISLVKKRNEKKQKDDRLVGHQISKKDERKMEHADTDEMKSQDTVKVREV